MDEVLQFIKECGVFFIATADGDAPRVRPFGFIMAFEGKLYFSMNNKKLVYQQLQINPKTEICALHPDGRWIRLRGNARFSQDKRAKENVFITNPNMANLYQNADNPIFEIFALEDAVADIYSRSDETRTIVF